MEPLTSTEPAEYTNVNFRSLSHQGAKIRSKSFYDCVFERCQFSETSITDCQFVDCAFKDCDLSLVSVVGCTFTGVVFNDSKAIGINWTEAKWTSFLKPVAFHRCNLSHSTYIGLPLKGLTMTHCVANNADFAEADLSKGNFSHTDFTDCRFLHTNLTEADFTHATNYAINAGLNKLKGTKFSLPEALSLLHSLDIILVED